MNLIDYAHIHRFHEARIRDFGEGTTQALGWKNFYSQHVRFGMLEGIGDMNDRSVLDAGCGHGDLRAYLDDQYPRLRYLGIDQMEGFLDVAIERYAHLPETAFFLGDFCHAELPRTDYVLACGSLNYFSTEPDFVYRAITKLFNSCRLAFGFNLMSKVDAPGGILVAYEPEAIIRFCRNLTSNVILHEGYFEGDFTIWMYREDYVNK